MSIANDFLVPLFLNHGNGSYGREILGLGDPTLFFPYSLLLKHPVTIQDDGTEHMVYFTLN